MAMKMGVPASLFVFDGIDMGAASEPLSQEAIDLVLRNPPFGPWDSPMAGSEATAPDLLDAAVDDLRANEPAAPTEPTPEPDLSGLDWVREEFDRLRMLPFATSNLGSSTRPKKRARDNALGRRLYGPTQPWNHAQVTGRQYPHENRITVTVGPKATRARVSELLMHELAHAACPTEHGAPDKGGWRRRIYHGRTFREWLVRAAKEAYGLDISPTAAGRSAYKLDAFIIAALEAKGGEWSLAIGQ